jgi:hypothetical protein
MSESLLGVPDLAGLGTALHGSTSPYDALAFGMDAASGSNDEPFDVEVETKAEEARLPPIRRGALNIVECPDSCMLSSRPCRKSRENVD